MELVVGLFYEKLLREEKEALAALFYDTVHTVNVRDYTKEQLDAWATGKVDLDSWNRSFLEHETVVVVEHGRIVGFGDMDRSGYLDRFCTHASITARPFFEKRGYQVVKEQTVERNGVGLTNYVMIKSRRG